MILKAFKYQLSPTSEQSEMLNKHFGCARFVYNWGLNEKSKAYTDNGTNVSCFDLIKKVTELKKCDDYNWLSEVHSQPLQMALRNLDNAFTGFFKKRSKFPNFKKKSRKQSFQYPQGVKLKDNMIFLPKIGWVKYYKSRDIIGEIKTVTVSKTPTGKIFVSILCDTKLSIPTKKPVSKETSVGIDLGIKSFAVTSDGEIFENQKYLTNNLKRLRVEQRKLQRCKKGSNGREKQRLVVAKIHERITNQRLDYIHKFTTHIVKEYDTIVMEDLNVAGMMKNGNLSRAIGEIGWSIANAQLEYKCEWYGKNYIKIGRFDPSSKRCNHCGYINRELKLSQREWTCPDCHTVLDRDMNAALNIRDYGLGAHPSDAKVNQ